MNTGVRVRSLLLIVVSFWLSFNRVKAQSFEEYQSDIYISQSDTLQYRILYPNKFNKDKKYPLILFLHGSGERGNDNQKQLVHGGDLFLNPKNRKKFPAIVIFPQCPENQKWSHYEKIKNDTGDVIFKFQKDEIPTIPAHLANNLVDEFIKSGNVNTSKIYVMGLSMGGIGTLDFLYRWPDKYSGAVVICGGGDDQLADKYSNIPVWFFHGAKDDVVPPKYSEQVFKVLKPGNSNTKYTLFPNDNHNS